jgi:ketosteroid isomerase-like protein
MRSLEQFLTEVVPALENEVHALQNGNAAPRKALWSHNEPLSLFGAERTARGWREVEPIFDRLAGSFSDGQSCTYEVVSADLSGDLGYVAAIERSSARTGDNELQQYTLRVTTIFRFEDGQWKVVHRHGDPLDEASREFLDQRRRSGVM